MASVIDYLGSAFSSGSGSFAVSDQIWSEKNLDLLVIEVEQQLQEKGIDYSQLPNHFIIKCLRQGSGDVKHSSLVCIRFLNFRHRVKWPMVLSLNDININALKSNMHWIFGDKTGKAIFVFNPENLNITLCSIEEYQKMGMYLMEQLIQYKQIQNHGVILVFDCRRINIKQIFSMIGYEDAKRGTEMWQDAFPCRLRSILVIGLSVTTSSFIKLFLNVLPQKLRKRVLFVSMEEASEIIGKDYIPPSMNGKLKLEINKPTFTTNMISSSVITTTNDNEEMDENSIQRRSKYIKNIKAEEEEENNNNDENVYEDAVEDIVEEEDDDAYEDASDEEPEEEVNDVHDDGDDVKKNIEYVHWNWVDVVSAHIRTGGPLFKLKKPPQECDTYDHKLDEETNLQAAADT